VAAECHAEQAQMESKIKTEKAKIQATNAALEADLDKDFIDVVSERDTQKSLIMLMDVSTRFCRLEYISLRASISLMLSFVRQDLKNSI
jgi:hypothetical protein